MKLRRPIVADVDRVVAAFAEIDERIVPRPDLDRAAAMLTRLPRVPWWYILETRVLGAAPATDLFAGALRDPTTIATLLAEADAPTAQPAFFSAWADDAGPAADSNVMWFEWDAPITGRAPHVWYSLDETFWPQPGRTPSGLPTTARIRHLRRVAGAPDDPDHVAPLARVIDALPAEARLFGSMWRGVRGRDVDRMFVNLPQPAALPWLEAIGWPGDAARARTWLQRVAAPWERALIQVEVSDRLEPYLAVETLQSDWLPAPRSAREQAYFDWLVEAHGAPAHHLRALRAWRRVTPLEPSSERGEARSDRGGVAGGVERRSFHVKAVLEHERPPVVKGYFGVYIAER